MRTLGKQGGIPIRLLMKDSHKLRQIVAKICKRHAIKNLAGF